MRTTWVLGAPLGTRRTPPRGLGTCAPVFPGMRTRELGLHPCELGTWCMHREFGMRLSLGALWFCVHAWIWTCILALQRALCAPRRMHSKMCLFPQCQLLLLSVCVGHSVRGASLFYSSFKRTFSDGRIDPWHAFLDVHAQII